MLDDKTVTEHNIEDKSVQEVTAEATKVCCQCGKELPLSRFRMEIRPNGKKAYRSKCKYCTWLDHREKKLQKKTVTDKQNIMITKRLIREVRQDLERNGYSCIPY